MCSGLGGEVIMKITMETVIMFKRTSLQTSHVFVDGVELVPERSFNWGYFGTGPALLARALLKIAGLSVVEVQNKYHAFKTEVVGTLRHEDILTGEDVLAWVKVTRNEESAMW